MIFFHFSQVYDYSTAHTADAVFIIGGHCNSGNVAKYEDDEWTIFGKLNHARWEHSSITINDQTIIVGGARQSAIDRYVDLGLIRSQIRIEIRYP